MFNISSPWFLERCDHILESQMPTSMCSWCCNRTGTLLKQTSFATSYPMTMTVVTPVCVSSASGYRQSAHRSPHSSLTLTARRGDL